MKSEILTKVNKGLLIRWTIVVTITLLYAIAIVNLIVESNQVSKFSGGKTFNYIDLFEPGMFIIGSFLLVINRKLSDYISFAIFIFLIGGVFSFEVSRCAEMVGFTNCIRTLPFDEKSFILLIIASPLIFLLVNFIKNIGKE